jgi:hypothetical protein
VVVAILSAAVGATATYAVLEFGPWASQSVPFSGGFTNATLTAVQVAGSAFPILNASLVMNSPSSLDPAGLTITIAGPAGTELEAMDCGQPVWVHELRESYLANEFPHWMVSFPATTPGSVPGALCMWDAYAVTFTNPNGGIVGGNFNASYATASSIESAARMSMEFPGGPGFSPTGAGFTIALTEAGHPGFVTLTTD